MRRRVRNRARFNCPIHELSEAVFSEGLGFDGSPIRGWKGLEASDLLALPDAATALDSLLGNQPVRVSRIRL